MVKFVELRDKNASLHDQGTHHGLWTHEDQDWDEILARLTGIPKALLPAHLDDEPDVIEAEVIEVSDKSEERSLTPARESTDLPADVASNTNREHDLEKRPETELPQQHEPTYRESVVSNPLTPSKVELDEKAPRENKLRGYRRLNREKSAVEYGLKAFRKLDSEKPKA